MTTINVPLLRRVLEFITAPDDEWDPERRGDESVLPCQPYVFRCLDETTDVSVVMPGRIDIGARNELRLTHHDGARLFDPTNSLYDLWSIASELTNGEIQIRAVRQCSRASERARWEVARTYVNDKRNA